MVQDLGTDAGTSERLAPRPVAAWGVVVVMVYLLLVAVGVVGDGFGLAVGGREGAERLFAFATNPFVGVLLGTLTTALVQSSSTVTSIIVGLVAGGLPVSVAIPMVMGANMGTTVTNTLVSLGHMGRPDEFRRAFAAATVHDWFNLLGIAIFLPVEVLFGLIERASAALLTTFVSLGTYSTGGWDVLGSAVRPGRSMAGMLADPMPERWGGVLLIGLGVVLILVSITYLGRALKTVMVGRARRLLHAAIGRGPGAGILSGTVVTVLVQSSSTTTSLMVPLAAGGVFTLREVYPFTLGANIGTTITALLAATAVMGGNREPALQIALAHFLFNVFAVTVVYGVPWLRRVPLRGAGWIAELGAERKGLALAYVLAVFFAVPAILTFVTLRLF